MTTNEAKEFREEMEEYNRRYMARIGYCKCVQCDNWHNLDNTSSRNWLDGVCSDKCSKEAPPIDKSLYND